MGGGGGGAKPTKKVSAPNFHILSLREGGKLLPNPPPQPPIPTSPDPTHAFAWSCSGKIFILFHITKDISIDVSAFDCDQRQIKENLDTSSPINHYFTCSPTFAIKLYCIVFHYSLIMTSNPTLHFYQISLETNFVHHVPKFLA